MNLGFIGLGAMGLPMAGRLLKAGHGLTVWSRRAEAAAPLQAAGARVCASPAEVAQHAAIVFTMVTGSDDVAAVVLGEEGLVHGGRSRNGQFSTLVDMSTISPERARQIAGRLGEHGIRMLDAPVSGGATAAANGALAIMVGGPAETLAQVRPLFDLLGKTIVHVGENGAGQVAKACNQMVMVAAIQACAEAMRLAEASAVDPRKVRLALQGGSAGSRVLEVFGERMVGRDFTAGVEARLHHKDFGILLNEAHRLGCPLPIAAGVGQQLNALMGQGWGRDDSAALLRVAELEGGRKVIPRIDQLSAGELRKILLEQQAILDNATVGILFSRNRVVAACNALCAEMFGYGPGEMVGLPGQELYPSLQAYDELGRIAGPTLAAGQPYHAEIEYRRKDGTLFWSRVSAKAVDPLNTQGGTIWIIEDIGEERSVREALAKTTQESDARVRAALAEQELIFNNAAVGMVFVRNRIVRRCNRKFEEIFGYAQGELSGSSTLMFYPTVRDYDEHWERAYEPLRRGETVSGEERMRRKDGSLFWIRSTGCKTDAPGLGLDVIWIFEDVSGRHQAEEALLRARDEFEQRVVERTTTLTASNQQLQAEIFERMEAEQRIWHIAHHDALTGLPNRSLLHDRLDQALTQATRSEHRVAVFFLDLDRFKSVNDTLGHHVGDQLLVHVAERLREAVRAVDIVSRLGGDEFVVILPEIQGADDATRVAQKIIAALAPAATVEGNLLYATPSIGISIFPDHASEAYALMKHADTAMYHAKADGRNTFRFYEAAMNSAAA